MPLRLTIFDLDHTLLRINCSLHFGIYLYKKKCFSTLSMIRFLAHYLHHKLLGSPIAALHQQIFAKLFLGRYLSEIEAHVENYLNLHFSSIHYPPAVTRLQEALKRGDHIAILSNGPHFLVKAIAKRFNVAHWDATHYAVDQEQRFNTISKMLEGRQKADYIKAFAAKFGIAKKQITAYSDSYLDLPLLEAAGVPIGVRPDKTLKRICKQNGWEMI